MNIIFTLISFSLLILNVNCANDDNAGKQEISSNISKRFFLGKLLDFFGLERETSEDNKETHACDEELNDKYGGKERRVLNATQHSLIDKLLYLIGLKRKPSEESKKTYPSNENSLKYEMPSNVSTRFFFNKLLDFFELERETSEENEEMPAFYEELNDKYTGKESRVLNATQNSVIDKLLDLIGLKRKASEDSKKTYPSNEHPANYFVIIKPDQNDGQNLVQETPPPIPDYDLNLVGEIVLPMKEKGERLGDSSIKIKNKNHLSKSFNDPKYDEKIYLAEKINKP